MRIEIAQAWIVREVALRRAIRGETFSRDLHGGNETIWSKYPRE